MMVTLEMFQWAKTLMVCATAHHCPKEEACFHLAKSVIDAWEAQEHRAALLREEAPTGLCPRLYDRMKELTGEPE